jgi:hypothetical protein
MPTRTHSQGITLRDISDFRHFPKPPEDSQHPRPNPDPIARISKGKGGVFLTEVFVEGPLGGDPEGDPDNPGDPGDNEPPQENPDNGNPEDLNDLTDDMLMRQVLTNIAKHCQPEAHAKVHPIFNQTWCEIEPCMQYSLGSHDCRNPVARR